MSSVGAVASTSSRLNGFSSLGSEEFLGIILKELSNQDPLQPSETKDLLEQLSLDRTTERRPLPLLLCGEVETLARLLRRMAGPFGLEVEEAPWGLDWSIPALQLRVYLETDGAPAYEILRL